MTVLALFAFRFGRMVRRLAGRVAEGPWCGAGRGVAEGLALVWRHRGDGYFLQFTWHPNRPSRALQGTFRFQVEPNWAHLEHFKGLTT